MTVYTLLRRWRFLTLARRAIGVLRLCVLLHAGMNLLRTVLLIRKRKGR